MALSETPPRTRVTLSVNGDPIAAESSGGLAQDLAQLALKAAVLAAETDRQTEGLRLKLVEAQADVLDLRRRLADAENALASMRAERDELLEINRVCTEPALNRRRTRKAR